MGLFSLDFPEQMDERVRSEFESHFAKLRKMLGVSLNEDGTIKTKAEEPGDITVISQLQQEHGQYWPTGPWSLSDYSGGAEGSDNANYVLSLDGGTINNFGDDGQISGAVLVAFGVNAATTITGIVNDTPFPRRHRFLIVKNIYQSTASKTVTLKHNSSSSRFENRLFLPGLTDIILAPGEAAWFLWISGQWELVVTGQSSGGMFANLSSPMLKATKTFSASGDYTVAQMKALSSSPQIMVPAVSGSIIVPVAWSLDELRGGTDTFDSSPSFSLLWNSVAGSAMQTIAMINGASAGTKQFTNAGDRDGAGGSAFTNTAKGVDLTIKSNTNFASTVGTGSNCAWRFTVLYYLMTSVN